MGVTARRTGPPRLIGHRTRSTTSSSVWAFKNEEASPNWGTLYKATGLDSSEMSRSNIAEEPLQDKETWPLRAVVTRKIQKDVIGTTDEIVCGLWIR